MKENTMRIIPIIIVSLFVILAFCVTATTPVSASTKIKSKNYALATIVVEIETINDTVIVKDCNNNLWAFYGIDDWNIGDGCSIIMNNNRTKKIYDDIIVSTKYFNIKKLKK